MLNTLRVSTFLWWTTALLWLVVAAGLYRAFNGYLSHTGQFLPFLVEIGMACGSAYLAYFNHRRPEGLRRTAKIIGVVSLTYAVMLIGFLPGFGLVPSVVPLGVFGFLVPLATSTLAFITAARNTPQDPTDEIPRKVRDSF